MGATTQLHVVTGKGGTGKTTVAAALAIALADQGQRVLLCEVEGRQGIAQLFDVPPLPYEERRIASGLGGGQVHALAIDPEAALLEYLDMYYHLGRAGKLLDRFGVVDFATTIAPGVRDVLLTGKAYEAARRKENGRFVYDAVVMDAPPTGRITRFLNVNAEVAGLAKVGPVRKQADAIMDMLHSDSSRVHLVTVLEEMPVQETLDGVTELRGAGLPVGHVLVNLVRPALLSEASQQLLGTDGVEQAVADALEPSGVDGTHAPALVEEGHAHVARQHLQDAQHVLLDDADVPVHDLPWLSEGVDLGALFELAQTLRDGKVV